jgi:hypothetical protein
MLSRADLDKLCIIQRVLVYPKDSDVFIIGKLLQTPLKLQDLKIHQLKTICRQEGLPVGGLHEDLVRRLQAQTQADGTQGPATPATKTAKVSGAAPAVNCINSSIAWQNNA